MKFKSPNARVSDKILILGNGPSLKEEYFEVFSEFPTLGMNAAYRYWERIKWFPDYYCCLDDQVVLSHSEKICDMIEHQRCSKFFLHDNFFRKHPEMVGLDGVIALCQLWPGVKNHARCEDLGVEHTPSNIFHSTSPGKFTTGAYAVRFAAYLGYRTTGLIGIDCRYVEIIPEATTVEGNVLELKATPKTNQNYFFSDYQVSGDRYNVPNPTVHGGNLHYQAFEILKTDIERYSIDLNVYICTRDTELFDQKLFPYVELGRFVRGAYLSAIMVPFTDRDTDPLLARFRTWAHPDFAPCSQSNEAPRLSLCLCYNGSRNEQAEAKFSDNFRKAGLDRYFKNLKFFYSNLKGLKDLYTRQFSGPVGADGYMAGPNNQFFDIITKFSKGMAHVMLMEADVVPIRRDWLSRLEELVGGSERFWICGSHYRGVGHVKAFWHVNGNAIYNVGDPGFQDFFSSVFIPYFTERVKTIPSLAYDIVLHDLFHRLFAGKADAEDLRRWGDYAHRIRFSEFIVDVSHSDDRREENLLNLVEARHRFPDCVLLHGATAKIENNIARYIAVKTGTPLIISVDCDAVDHFGHFLAYDLHVARAARAAGADVMILGNVRFDCVLASELDEQVEPTFTHNSWLRKPEHIAKFVAELSAALDKIEDDRKDGAIFLYMYCAGLEHAEEIARVIRGRPRVYANVNLFWAYNLNEHVPSVAQRWWPLFNLAAEGARFVMTVPTTLMCKDFSDVFGVVLPVAPHPSTTFSDPEALALAGSKARRLKGRPRVLFPGGVREEKGFALSIGAATLLAQDEGLDCYVRAIIRPDTPPNLLGMIKKLDGSRVNVISNIMVDGDFKEFLAVSDLIVCPYLPSAFSRRTSGLVIDAILLGCPFVAIRGTWLADLADATGAGVAADADSGSIVECVRRVLDDYDSYSRKTAEARREYLAEHSWTKLIETVIYASESGKRLGGMKPLLLNPLLSANASHIPVLGPFERQINGHLDETQAIAKVFTAELTGNIMIDVGAHHGSAFLPFLHQGWQIFAFEPDEKNRAKLLERLAKHKNEHLVSLDTRCVSNESQKGVSFFTSEQSTGISGLSAFHESHVEAQKVDTVTLTEFFQDKPMPAVDFLKVDTEGHDLFVLQGFPWERGKPAVIECEFEDIKTVPLGYTFHDLARFLVDKGYSVYVSEWHPIIRYGIRHDWHRLVRYPCELADPKAWGNLLAFRDPIDESKLVEAVRKVLKIGQPESVPKLAVPTPSTQTRPVSEAAAPKALPSPLHPAPEKRRTSVFPPNTLIVIGNGPSLRGFDLSSLDGAATIGMNAAYRHWDRIGWYPTYYMCLDTVVTESHRTEIHRLIRDSAHNGIQRFLIRQNLVDAFPDLRRNPQVIAFENYLVSKYFADLTTSLTTGSFAPLFAAMLGYRRVILLGIDLNYVQQIPEARTRGGHVLEITQTPQRNPNYFFDDYQRQGDRYNIPDSLPDLHYQSWVRVKQRLDELGVDVINGNPRSRLANLFDTLTLDDL